uniref:Acid phosphatase n=1 Tax=Alexandrium catenella TaxID=2925 RepID=A0A7S1KZA1_ALECA
MGSAIDGSRCSRRAESAETALPARPREAVAAIVEHLPTLLPMSPDDRKMVTLATIPEPTMFGLPREPEALTKELEEDGLSEGSTECSSPSVEERVAALEALPRQAPTIATLFILDWDDTIMPTTWLHSAGLLADPASVNRHWGQLSVVADAAARTLSTLKQLGQIVIVTNAEEGWVQQSTVLFMPGLMMLLLGVQVISARTLYGQRIPNAPLEWKRLAFESIIGSFRKRLSPGQQANVVSVGDLVAEQAALRSATRDVPECWGKSMKLQEHPHLGQLVHEHQLLQSGIRWVVAQPRDLDLSCEDECSGQK